MGLSVGIITKNEEKRLGRTLEAIKNLADEIVIVDSGSTDKTEEIALSYGAKFYREDWKGYGLQKNSVIDKCSEEYILLIDADEVVSDKLKRRIEKTIKEKDGRVFEINFTSVCFGKIIKHGGWSGSYRIRLFRKDSGRYNDNRVHEEFITNEKIIKLKEDILHYSYEDLYDYLSKFNRYTSEGAKELIKRKKSLGINNIVFKPGLVFLKMYVLRLGFLDGIEGFLLACFSSIYTMSKYYKAIEIKKGKI